MKKIDYPTLRDIVTEYAPEMLDKIEKKYILSISWFNTEHYGAVYTSDIADGFDTYAFDSIEGLKKFLECELEDIREDIARAQKSGGKISYHIEAQYNEIDCIITDEDVDLDVYSAEFPEDRTRTAYFEWGDLGTAECTEYVDTNCYED